MPEHLKVWVQTHIDKGVLLKWELLKFWVGLQAQIKIFPFLWDHTYQIYLYPSLHNFIFMLFSINFWLLCNSLDVARTSHVVAWGRRREPRRVHLHDQSLVFLLSIFGLLAINKHEDGGYDVTQAWKYCKCVAPWHVVKIGVEKPVTAPALCSKNAHRQEKQYG